MATLGRAESGLFYFTYAWGTPEGAAQKGCFMSDPTALKQKEGESKNLSDMEEGQLLDLYEQEQENASAEEDVVIPEELLGENGEISEDEEVPGEGETPSREDEERPEYLKDLPFKSAEELAAGYKNLNSLLGQQATKNDNLERQLEAFGGLDTVPQRGNQTQNQGVSQFQQVNNVQNPENLTYDPMDQNSIDRYLQARINQVVSPHLSRIQNLESQLTTSVRLADQDRWREQADTFVEAHPEYAIQDNYDSIVNVMKLAKANGHDVLTAHPEAGKVLAVVELVNMVRNSNGIIKDMEHAYRSKMVEGSGLEKLLLEQKKKTKVETVKQIDSRKRAAPNLSKVGGRTKEKRLSDLSDEELYSLAAAVDGKDADSRKERRLERF